MGRPALTERDVKTNKAFGMRLNTLLAENDMKQMELADRIGVTDKTVSVWCAGKLTISIFRLLDISEVFGVSTDWLLKGGRRE